MKKGDVVLLDGYRWVEVVSTSEYRSIVTIGVTDWSISNHRLEPLVKFN